MVDMLVVSAVMTTIAGAVYAFVGSKLGARNVSERARPAQRCFVFWWAALAAISFTSAAMQVLYVAGDLPIWLYRVFTQMVLILLVGALACLLYYLIFVYTGSPRAWVAPVVYGIVTFLVIEMVLFLSPTTTSVTDDGWRIQTEPEADLPRAVGLAFSLLIIGPQIAAAVAYALLWRRAADATARYRIAMVSASIIVWFSAGTAASLAGVAESRAWQIGSQMLSLAAAATILMAYLPPAAWRARWGLRSIADEAA